MKIQTAIITIAVVLMIILCVTAFTTFSFAVRTNTTHSQSITTSAANTTKTVSSQITTKNPVATLTSGTDPCVAHKSDTTFYWDHTYGVEGNGKEKWNRPNPTLGITTPSRLQTIHQCVTVTGNVSSQIGGGTSHDKDGDGDLHFTLQLDPQFKGYSNQYDPKGCLHKGQTCYTVIVEIICHVTPAGKYKFTWGDYCKDVDSSRVPLAGTMPPQGERLSVSGRLVTDKSTPGQPSHDPWNEIHPAIDVHKIP